MSVREPTWDERIFEVCPAEIDRAQLRENLRRTPAERLARLQDVVNALDELRRSRRRAAPR